MSKAAQRMECFLDALLEQGMSATGKERARLAETDELSVFGQCATPTLG